VTSVLSPTEQSGGVARYASIRRSLYEKARQLKPDLIILDFSMSVMNGLETAAVLSREMPLVPLILFTMHIGAVMASDARSASVSAVVSKDLGSEGLVSRALTLLGLPSDR
jgi:two-component system nitrate/nitrite response regulator NarL